MGVGVWLVGADFDLWDTAPCRDNLLRSAHAWADRRVIAKRSFGHRYPIKGEKVMGDKGGKKDKSKKEQQKIAKHTLMEKRKLKKEK